MRRFLVNNPARLGMEQTACLDTLGSIAVRIAVGLLRNSPCPPAWLRHGSNSPRRPAARRTASAREVPKSPFLAPASPAPADPTLVISRVADPRLCDSRSSRLLHPTASPSGQGSRDFAGETRWCVTNLRGAETLPGLDINKDRKIS
jgi:hypothetical protein